MRSSSRLSQSSSSCKVVASSCHQEPSTLLEPDLFLPGPSTNRKYYVFVSTRFCICRTAWCSVSERGAGFVSAALSTEENWVHVFFSLSYSHSSKHLCGSLLKSAMFQNGSEQILDIAFRVCESCPAFIWFPYNTATK